MTSSMSKARPSTIMPCAVSTSTITNAVSSNTRTSPRAFGNSIGSRMPNGTPSRTLPPICLTVSRTSGWSRYARMDAPGLRLVWIRWTDAGDGTRVTLASATAKATIPVRASAITAARANMAPSERRCSTGVRGAAGAASPVRAFGVRAFVVPDFDAPDFDAPDFGVRAFVVPDFGVRAFGVRAFGVPDPGVPEAPDVPEISDASAFDVLDVLPDFEG